MHKIVAALSLGLVAACASTHAIDPRIASPSVDFAQAERVEVTLSNFDYSPETIRLKAGVPYALVLVNSASDGHDFTAPEFFAAARIMADDAARITDGQIDLQAGQTATIRLVPAAGTYDLVCTHTGHALLGMKGKIIVR